MYDHLSPSPSPSFRCSTCVINGGDPAAAARLKVSPFSPSPFSLSSGGWMTSSSKLMGNEREFKELHITLFPEVRGGKGGDGEAMSGS